MKVLHISAGYLYGGVERVLATLAECRELCPAMEPYFAVCFEGRLSGELRAAGVTVHTLGAVRVSKPWTIWRARAALRTVLASGHFDCVVCHLPWAHAIFGPVTRRAGLAPVFWMHGFATGSHWTERWARRTPARLVIANSHATAATAGLLFPDAQAAVLYNPVLASRDLARAPRSGLTILQVSRMEPWKGHALLLEALALLPRDLDWQCRIVGGAQRPQEQRYASSLRALSDRLGIGASVHFEGESSNVIAILVAADIFCQPNLAPEPFGLVFIEALTVGVPVVTTNLGAAPEIIDESCGLLVEPANPKALAAALERLLRDASLRNRFCAAGPARAFELCDPAHQLSLLYRFLGGQ